MLFQMHNSQTPNKLIHDCVVYLKKHLHPGQWKAHFSLQIFWIFQIWTIPVYYYYLFIFKKKKKKKGQ